MNVTTLIVNFAMLIPPNVRRNVPFTSVVSVSGVPLVKIDTLFVSSVNRTLKVFVPMDQIVLLHTHFGRFLKKLPKNSVPPKLRTFLSHAIIVVSLVIRLRNALRGNVTPILPHLTQVTPADLKNSFVSNVGNLAIMPTTVLTAFGPINLPTHEKFEVVINNLSSINSFRPMVPPTFLLILLKNRNVNLP